MQVHIDQGGVHEAGDLDFKEDAGVVLRLRKHKLVAPFVALADVTLGVIYTYRFFFLLFLVKVTEIGKHGVFLGLPIRFLLLCLHF